MLYTRRNPLLFQSTMNGTFLPESTNWSPEYTDSTPAFEMSTISSLEFTNSTQDIAPAHLTGALFLFDLFINPVIMALGVCSNIIMVLVLWNDAKTNSLANYLFGLAIVDLAYLFIFRFTQFLYYGLRVNVLPVLGCSLVPFLIYYLGQVSSWFLCLFCIERAHRMSLNLVNPEIKFTPCRARVAMFVLATLLLLLNCPFLGVLEPIDIQAESTYLDIFFWLNVRLEVQLLKCIFCMYTKWLICWFIRYCPHLY